MKPELMRVLVSVILPFAAGAAFAAPDFLIFSLFIDRAVSTGCEAVDLALFVQNTSTLSTSAGVGSAGIFRLGG
jgi:hypothetical protein